jgi:hypothetical protein
VIHAALNDAEEALGRSSCCRSWSRKPSD